MPQVAQITTDGFCENLCNLWQNCHQPQLQKNYYLINSTRLFNALLEGKSLGATGWGVDCSHTMKPVIIFCRFAMAAVVTMIINPLPRIWKIRSNTGM